MKYFYICCPGGTLDCFQAIQISYGPLHNLIFLFNVFITGNRQGMAGRTDVQQTEELERGEYIKYSNLSKNARVWSSGIERVWSSGIVQDSGALDREFEPR